MRVLVIGKAKTGTKALRPIVTEALEDAIYEDWELTPVTSLRSKENSAYVRRIALE